MLTTVIRWICAFAPSFTVISNVLPFFFVMFSLFNGVVRPWSALSPVWRYWIYYMNPSTYWISGTLAATLPSAPVRCAPSEAAYFSPPPNMTCQDYAGAFVQAAGQGYLTNPSGTADCGYCPFKDGTEYMATLNIVPDDKWKYFGIFLAFCVSNWAVSHAPSTIMRLWWLIVNASSSTSLSTRQESGAGHLGWGRSSDGWRRALRL